MRVDGRTRLSLSVGSVDFNASGSGFTLSADVAVPADPPQRQRRRPSTDPVAPAGEVKPVDPAAQIKPVEPAAQIKPVEPAAQIKPVEPAAQMKPAAEARPVRGGDL